MGMLPSLYIKVIFSRLYPLVCASHSQSFNFTSLSTNILTIHHHQTTLITTFIITFITTFIITFTITFITFFFIIFITILHLLISQLLGIATFIIIFITTFIFLLHHIHNYTSSSQSLKRLYILKCTLVFPSVTKIPEQLNSSSSIIGSLFLLFLHSSIIIIQSSFHFFATFKLSAFFLAHN